MRDKIFSLRDFLLGSGGISLLLSSGSTRGIHGGNGIGVWEKTAVFLAINARAVPLVCLERGVFLPWKRIPAVYR